MSVRWLEAFGIRTEGIEIREEFFSECIDLLLDFILFHPFLFQLKLQF